jgi:1-deoxy-D-xylulose-5-phosphate reductoisomerase
VSPPGSAAGPARTVAILGSTGSIGVQAAEVIAAHPGRFNVVGLAARGTDPAALASQIIAFAPAQVAVADDAAATAVREALAAAGAGPGGAAEFLTGPGAVEHLAGGGADVVLNAVSGAIGLGPTLAALAAGSTLALANKESLVAGGAVVKAAVRREGQIVPVDSEHSAIAQCLRAGRAQEVSRLVLTASGGPFRGRRRSELAAVTPVQALAHPTWSMGPVVTVNSATLMNKALELIEASLLFDIPAERIDVVVHPQSIVHSMVLFRDGAVIAQASPPDMRLPIALGLAWPERLGEVSRPLTWGTASSWDFEPLDAAAFGAVDLAREAVAASPLHPAVLNAANELAVEAFLAGRTGFLDIEATVRAVLGAYVPRQFTGSAPRVADVMAAQEWGRARAARVLEARRAAGVGAVGLGIGSAREDGGAVGLGIGAAREGGAAADGGGEAGR